MDRGVNPRLWVGGRTGEVVVLELGVASGQVSGQVHLLEAKQDTALGIWDTERRKKT